MVACWSAHQSWVINGGNWTSSAWKFLSGFTETITLLYLEFFVGDAKVNPFNISSSVSDTEADPVVSITNLYLPWTYGR